MPLKHLLTDEELIEALTHYNGTPKAILDNKNTLSFFLRILRNDFLVNDRLLADNPKKTTVPLLALYGDDAGTRPVWSGGGVSAGGARGREGVRSRDGRGAAGHRRRSPRARQAGP